MKPISRRSAFIFYILSYSAEIISSATIANILGVSIRSVKNSIHELKLVQEELGINLKSIHAQGYQIDITDFPAYESAKLQYSIEYNSFNHHDLVGRSRSNSIVRSMILREDYLTLDELEASIFLSQSTIKQVLINVKDKLRQYNLELIYKHKKGYRIQGSEINIRMCAVEMYELHHHQAIQSPDDDYLSMQFSLYIKHRNAIRHVLLENLYKTSLSCIDTLTQRLSLYLTLSLLRISRYALQPITRYDFSSLDMERAFSVSTAVFSAIQHLGIYDQEVDFQGEIQGFAMLLMTFADVTVDDDVNALFPRIIPAVNSNVQQALIPLLTRFQLPQSSDLTDQLRAAFIPLYYKVTFSTMIKTTIIGSSIDESEIKKHPLAITFAQTIAADIKERLNYSLDDYTINLLAVNIHAALNRVQIPRKPKRIIISSKNGRNASLAIKQHLLKTFSSHLFANILIAELYEIRHLNLEDYDFVILGFAQYTYRYSLPFISISQLLSAEDLLAIQDKLFDNRDQMEIYYNRFAFKDTMFIDHIEANSLPDVFERFALRHGKNNQDIKYQKEQLAATTSALNIRNRICFVVLDKHPEDANIMEIYKLEKSFRWKKQDISYVLFLRITFDNSWEMAKVISLLLINLAANKDSIALFNEASDMKEMLLTMNAYFNS